MFTHSVAQPMLPYLAVSSPSRAPGGGRRRLTPSGLGMRAVEMSIRLAT